MDDLTTEEEPCEQCGLCCRIFGPGIAPTPTNVYVWMEQGRTDILRWFVAFMENASIPVNCTDLNAEDLGNVVVFEMRDPEHRWVCHSLPVSRPGRKEAVPLRDPSGKTRNVLHVPAMGLGRDVFQPVQKPQKDNPSEGDL